MVDQIIQQNQQLVIYIPEHSHQDIEFFLKEHSAGIKGLNVTYANNKLRITLTKAPDIVNGPYGTFDLYIRSTNVFTIVEVHVE